MEDASQFLELHGPQERLDTVTDLTNDTQDDLEDASQFLELALNRGLTVTVTDLTKWSTHTQNLYTSPLCR